MYKRQEKGQILSINQANDPARKYKEVWIGLGGVQSAVYATETSVEEYLTYTTEETEKLEVTQMTEKLGGNMEQAIRVLAMKKRILSMLFVLSPFMVPASVQAQWVVSDPGNLVQGIVNSVNEMVETSETAQNALSTWKETSKIFEQGREYYDKLRKVNDLISGSEKVKESVLMLSDISEIYVNNFGKMLTDKNFSQRELNAIAAGYNTIMKKSSRSIAELKNIINPTGMSMNDKERIDLVNRVYREMTHYKELANYYTRKNLHVSYLRAKEKNEQQQVFDLYGKDERYW